MAVVAAHGALAGERDPIDVPGCAIFGDAGKYANVLIRTRLVTEAQRYEPLVFGNPECPNQRPLRLGELLTEANSASLQVLDDVISKEAAAAKPPTSAFVWVTLVGKISDGEKYGDTVELKLRPMSAENIRVVRSMLPVLIDRPAARPEEKARP